LSISNCYLFVCYSAKSVVVSLELSLCRVQSEALLQACLAVWRWDKVLISIFLFI